MNENSKLVIVIALLFAAGAVIAIKHNRSSPGKKEPVESSGQSPVQQAVALPRLVDLGAGKCIPCKMMAPILEQLKTEYYGKLKVEFIDVWENPNSAKEYGIQVIPTQIFFDVNGKEMFRHEGFFSKEDILLKWKQLGVKLEKGQKDEKNN